MAEARDKTVFFVGQLGSMDKALSDALARRGIQTRTFRSTDDFRNSLGEGNCDLLVVDLDGDTDQSLGLTAELGRTLRRIPAIALVDHGDIATAIRAIRAGADNCLEKPVDTQQLSAEIQTLLDQAVPSPPCSVETLTPMEKTVLQLILEGKTNSETARTLHRSPRTIEVHRSHIMAKLGVSGMVDLARVASVIGLFDATGR